MYVDFALARNDFNMNPSIAPNAKRLRRLLCRRIQLLNNLEGIEKSLHEWSMCDQTTFALIGAGDRSPMLLLPLLQGLCYWKPFLLLFQLVSWIVPKERRKCHVGLSIFRIPKFLTPLENLLQIPSLYSTITWMKELVSKVPSMLPPFLFLRLWDLSLLILISVGKNWRRTLPPCERKNDWCSFRILLWLAGGV